MNRSLLPSLAAMTCVAFATFLPCASSFAQDKGPAKKPQTEVASKTAKFATVPASNAAVKKAIPATQLESFRKQIGKNATVVGTVDKVFTPRSNSVVVLNFAKDYRSAAQAALKSEHYAAFPDLKALQGKRVLVSGPVSEYHGSAQIDLSKPSQIQIIQ